jgi:mevalonate kinase
MKPIKASAPGKLILFGEHAVVHSEPALAVPLTALQATVTVETAPPQTGISILVPESHRLLHVNLADDSVDNALVYTARLALDRLGIAPPLPDLRLTLRSTIPLAAGFGSGAAVSAALARALSEALGRPLDNPTLNTLVYEVEKLHHGTPSGIDNTVIVYQQPVYFVRGAPLETLTIAQPFTLMVANAGHATPTHVTVGAVSELLEREPGRIRPIFARIGNLAREARRRIENGAPAALGLLMDENHALLRELTVSDDKLDALCEAARSAGALGAKLSGGGRGGNLIALVTAESAPAVKAALIAAGATQVFPTRVGG